MKRDILVRREKTTRIKSVDPIYAAQVGDWYWVSHIEEDYEEGKRDLYCISHKGSNFFRFRKEETRGSYSTIEVHFDKFEDRCKQELNWESIIQEKIETIKDEIKKRTRLLLAEGKRLCLVREKSEVPDSVEGSFLPAVTLVNPKKYKYDLIEFRDNKMPKLKKEIEDLSKMFAKETKNLALPDIVRLEQVKSSLEVVEDRIFTVELYCGLQESVVQISKGEPAVVEEPICIRQLLLYMDEETLFDYADGGMDFKKLEAFDEWVVRPENLKRILPERKGIVAFRVRRDKKNYGIPHSVSELIVNYHKNIYNMETYLLIRNGDQVYRIASQISFSPRLVPLKDEIGEKQFMTVNKWYDEDFVAEVVGPDSVDFDDHVAKQDLLIKKYNRIFIFIQGLLDRSTVFHPHLGIKLTIPEHLNVYISCIRDEEEVLANPRAIVWEEYRKQINKTIRKDNLVWSNWSPEDLGEYRAHSDYISYTTRESEIINRPGISKVKSIRRDRSEVLITWQVDRWKYGHYTRAGYWVDGGDSLMNRNLWVPTHEVFNIQGYNPGDYKMFLCDRTLKGDYLKWAAPLLSAEEYYRKKRIKG